MLPQKVGARGLGGTHGPVRISWSEVFSGDELLLRLQEQGKKWTVGTSGLTSICSFFLVQRKGWASREKPRSSWSS